ncbi:hypothetical protein D3C87_1251770 [compost metagenome]
MLIEFESNLSDELKRDFRRILELTGASMPIDALFADIGATPERIGSGLMSDDGLICVLEKTWKSLRSGGFAPNDIRDMLQVTEPFRSMWERASWKIEELMTEI